MGALVAKALRPIKSFNIENRAHRVISKDKPTPAPKYASNIEDMRRALQADPDLDDKINKKDGTLDDRLKEVYVTSHGRPEDDLTIEKRKQNPKRPLPQDRRMVPTFDFGFKEAETVPYGKVSLRKAIEFITAHQMNPEEVTVQKIASEYKLKEEDVAHVLKYYRSFELYIPATDKSPSQFIGPAATRDEVNRLLAGGESKLENTKIGVRKIEESKSTKVKASNG